MLDACWLTSIPERIGSYISSCKDILLIGLKEDISLQSSFFFVKSLCEIEYCFNACGDDENISGNVFIFKEHIGYFSISAFYFLDFGTGYNSYSILL